MNESKRIAKELRRAASQGHPSGPERQGGGDHATGLESPQEAPLNHHSNHLQVQTENRKTWSAPGLQVKYKEPTEEEIAALAIQLWQLRGCPEGSPEVDWYCALEALRAGLRIE